MSECNCTGPSHAADCKVADQFGMSLPLDSGLTFQRFGNAFVAGHADAIYVVSFYQNHWVAYYRMSGMPDPVQVGTHGFPNPDAAMGACNNMLKGIY